MDYAWILCTLNYKKIVVKQLQNDAGFNEHYDPKVIFS